jgi:rSAM/selenodomain-associated transferase 2
MAFLAVIIPVLNEEAIVAASLARLGPLREAGAEIIVVDGGSSDSTLELANPVADKVLRSARGRAAQMNAGAAAAKADVLLFLHLDSQPPPRADRLIAVAMADGRADWGHFDVEIDGRHAVFGMIAACMNLRARLSGIATGDQAIFVRRSLFEAAGGYPPIALMEDVALCKALRKRARSTVIPAKVRTSARRWEKNGIARTIVLMWWLRLRYFMGGNPDRLAAEYERG